MVEIKRRNKLYQVKEDWKTKVAIFRKRDYVKSDLDKRLDFVCKLLQRKRKTKIIPQEVPQKGEADP